MQRSRQESPSMNTGWPAGNIFDLQRPAMVFRTAASRSAKYGTVFRSTSTGSRPFMTGYANRSGQGDSPATPPRVLRSAEKVMLRLGARRYVLPSFDEYTEPPPDDGPGADRAVPTAYGRVPVKRQTSQLMNAYPGKTGDVGDGIPARQILGFSKAKLHDIQQPVALFRIAID